MGNRFFKILIVVLCCAPAGFLSGQETSPSNSSGSINVSKEQLDAIEKEIQSLRSQANRLASQENSIISMLDQYEVQSRMKAQEVAYFSLKQLKTEKDIEDLQAQFGQIDGNLRKQEAYLSTRLVQAYKLGELNYLRLLLLVNSAGDLLRTYQYVSYLAKDDSRRVDEYKNSIGKMEEMQMRLQQEKRNLVSLKGDSEQAQQELQQSRREKLRLLTAIQTQREMHLNALTELKRASNQLQNFFETVDSSGAYRKPITPMSKLKGQLDWPVRGKIIQEFGLQKNPKFATTTISNGVEIAATEGTPVHAVYDGEVVFSEWFKGYGKSIILSHPGGLYTLYAHNSELIAQRGDYVERGQVVARVGSTGSLSGASCLYFEIREKEQPVNPFQWLRRTIFAGTQ